MIVEQATRATEELVAALARLVPQLSSHAPLVTLETVEELLASPGTIQLVAREGGTIVGTLTLVLYRIPVGVRARIEDVIVDEVARGKGVGQALVREALRLAAAAGARTVELTSAPSRQAANRLYERLGFARRETNVYVWRTR